MAKKAKKVVSRNAGVNKKPKATKAEQSKAVDEKALAKAAKAAEKAKAQEKANGQLTTIAREVNVRLEKAEVEAKKADDHRLAAALKLAEGEEIAKNAGIKFIDWCKLNVKWAPETIRKMLPVAKADDPVKALADMRAGSAKRTAKSRAKSKGKVLRNTSVEPVALIEQMKPDQQLKTIKKVAEDLGMAVVTEAAAAQAGDAAAFGYDAVVTGFNGLKATEKMKFLRYAAQELGATVNVPGID